MDEKIRYVEFVDGHKDEDVSPEKATEKVEEAMDKGDFVTIESKDGKKTTTSVQITEEAKKEAGGDKEKERISRRKRPRQPSRVPRPSNRSNL